MIGTEYTAIVNLIVLSTATTTTDHPTVLVTIMILIAITTTVVTIVIRLECMLIETVQEKRTAIDVMSTEIMIETITTTTEEMTTTIIDTTPIKIEINNDEAIHECELETLQVHTEAILLLNKAIELDINQVRVVLPTCNYLDKKLSLNNPLMVLFKPFELNIINSR